MATSGTAITSNTDIDSHQYVNWWRTSVDYKNCTSTIYWQLCTYNHYSYQWNAIKNGGVSIDGHQYYTGGTWSNLSSGAHVLLDNQGPVVISQTSGQARAFNIDCSAWYWGADWVYVYNNPQYLDAIYKAATTGSVTGNTIGDQFKVAYTTYGGSYTYKLRITEPGRKDLEAITYNTSNAAFSLSQSTINTLVADFPNNSSFSLGFAVDTYSGNTRIAIGNETTITASLKKPTVNNVSHSNVSRTGVTISFNASSVVAISSKGVRITPDKTTFVVNATTSGNSYTANNLQANTKYYYDAFATNKGGTTYSSGWGEFTTSGNAPSLTNPYTTLTVGNAYVNCGQISYDTNASLKTRTLEYKKSSDQNYSTSGDGFNFTTQNNTNYDYRLTITDNFNRSSNITGTFLSAGNNPTVSLVPVNVAPTRAELEASFAFDNTTFSSGSYTLKQGSTTITTGNYNPDPTTHKQTLVLTSLKPNTDYTLESTVEDSAGRTSTSTYAFKTKPGIKINTMVATEFKVNGQIVKGLRLNGIDLF